MNVKIWDKERQLWLKTVHDVKHINNIEEGKTFALDGKEYNREGYSIEFVDE